MFSSFPTWTPFRRIPPGWDRVSIYWWFLFTQGCALDYLSLTLSGAWIFYQKNEKWPFGIGRKLWHNRKPFGRKIKFGALIQMGIYTKNETVSI